ncbi:hypothetical protein [Streptomyces tagetis]|uniref:Uncharacterized protein n=1 Tax=Streptomyces tagetis TaxID=2820809 RepID=A0A941AYZ6_9ACTN|nr:hypothetical protein [Streptomyces sp. RG38]MBQ0825640.1 hypothetical protein [Streptomyces sp. RG38]
MTSRAYGDAPPAAPEAGPPPRAWRERRRAAPGDTAVGAPPPADPATVAHPRAREV